MKNNILYIVGKVRNYKISSWEFAGVFNSLAKARKACLTESYFIAKTPLNKAYGEKITHWKETDYEYPLIMKTL